MGIDAEDFDGTGVGPSNAFEAFHGGGLAGAVGSDEAEDFALGDLEGDVIDDGGFAVSFGEAADADGGRGCHVSSECTGKSIRRVGLRKEFSARQKLSECPVIVPEEFCHPIVLKNPGTPRGVDTPSEIAAGTMGIA